MYVLIYKTFKRSQEPLTKNRSHLLERWEQLCLSEDRQALEYMISCQPERYRANYKIEELAADKVRI